MTEGKPIIGPRVVLEGATKTYGESHAIRDVTLDVAAGSFVALVGASGSGKSTLLKSINRLVALDAGRVAIDGADAANRPVHELRRAIGYVFQNVGLFPHMSVGENVAIGLGIAEWPGNRAARVAELLALVGLPREMTERMPASLSGGQAQRVGLARALAPAPGLMLMDEPFGALDPVTRDALGQAYRALHAELGLTTILVTHDMAEALLLADRIVVLDHGRIVADASPREMMAGGQGPEAEALLGVPRDQAARIEALAR